MPTTKRRWTRRVNRFPDRAALVSDAVRESAVEMLDKRAGVFGRAAKCYRGINRNSLSRARSTGGPFTQSVLWAAALDRAELARLRTWYDTQFDLLEAELAGRDLCIRTALVAQQEADAMEDVAETRAHLTGDWQEWLRRAREAEATLRIAMTAIRRSLVQGAA